MPWVKEQEDELNKEKTPEELKQKPKGPTQSTLSFTKKTPTTPIAPLIQTPKKSATTELSAGEKEAELKCRSHVIVLPAVDEFNFVFTDQDYPIKSNNNCQFQRELIDVEGILIHANWADYNFQIEATPNEPLAEKQRRESLKKMNLRIPDTVMKDGILFIWVEKEFTNDVILFFEQQGFAYVENLCYVMLDKAQ